ncbi:MAG TPA: hypothetical protein VFA85_03190 [Terriglobales bacterium]|nr:hypothetical protein [Terriglobales bacterium]
MRFLIFAVLTATACFPETQRETPSAKPVPILPPMVLHRVLAKSGQIFSGTVIKVEHSTTNSSTALATTSVQLRVDEAIRGVRKGQIVQVKEWAGLWQSGERYHPGERVLLFLYPPSKFGLTSPVGRNAGRFSVDTGGHVFIRPATGFPRKVPVHRIAEQIRRAEQE